jgi:hypothetical protein
VHVCSYYRYLSFYGRDLKNVEVDFNYEFHLMDHRVVTGGSRFLSYNFLQFAIDGKNNSKTKVEKVFFFIFMSSYAEMSWKNQKITK